MLAVAPEAVTWSAPLPGQEFSAGASDDARDQPMFAPREGYGLSAGVVARHFDETLIHLSTITVFAPKRMVTLNRNLKPANPYIGMRLPDKMRRLEASLSADQWKTLGSADGLGISDLTPQQQPIFEALLPEEPILMRATVTQSTTGVEDEYDDSDATPALTDSQRSGLRIRLDRSADLFLVNPKGEPVQGASAFHSDPVGTEKVMLSESADTFAWHSTRFGQLLRVRTPNRLKPSDLDLKAPTLNVRVPIGGATTVGDLIKATRMATGVELYVDGRLARLPVSLNGGTTAWVRAADLLEALCWALTSTYRQIGPTSSEPKTVAYELTYDQEGLAARRGRILEWYQRGEAERREAGGKFSEAIRKQNPRRNLSFAAGNLLSPTTEAEKAYSHPDPDQDTTTIPTSTLTAVQRQQLQDGLRQLQKQHQDDPETPADARSDRVGVKLGLTVTYVIPGVGEVHEGETWLDDTMGGEPDADAARNMAAEIDAEVAKAKPVSAHSAIVLVAAPRTRAQITDLIRSAAGRGVRQVWLRLSGDPADTGLLAECIAAGAARHIPVGVPVPVMRPPAVSRPGSGENINIYGETGPAWALHVSSLHAGLADAVTVGRLAPNAAVLDPAISVDRAVLKARLETIAATPGLAALALYDARAPGYSETTPQYQNTYGDGFGYTPENRLACLRQTGFDPIDLDDPGTGRGEMWDVMQVPFYDTPSVDEMGSYGSRISTDADFARWHSYLSAQQTGLLKSLRADLASVSPRLPVFLCSSEFAFETGLCRPWAASDPIPSDHGDDYDALTHPASAHGAYPITGLRPEDYEAAVRENELAGRFTIAMTLDSGLRGILAPDSGPPRPLPVVVVDLSFFPFPDAVRLIESVFRPVATGRD